MTVEIEEGIRVRITRRFAATPERVFRAFTDPAEAAVWMWAGMGANPSAEIDLRVGGRFRIAIDPLEGQEGWKGGDVAMSGVYAVIEPPHRLVYTLHWEASVGYNTPDAEVLDEAVVVDLVADGDGVVMVFQHVGIPDDGVSAPAHAEGIEASFGLLANLVEAG